jgi:spermidine dehydrogenase
MDRAITRRDFLGGVGIGLTGSLLYPWAEAGAAPYYPPAATGMRGSHDGSFEVAHALTRGQRWSAPDESGEDYALVVVGAGISGLSAAYLYRQQAGPDTRILIVDNHDDFGGHAKRNEFRHHGRLLLSNGGTVYIEDLGAYTGSAQSMLRELGIEIERFEEFVDREVYDSRGLRRGVFFDKETFGRDHLAIGEGDLPWEVFLAGAPLSEAVRRDIVRLQTERVDYLKGRTLAEKKALLQTMSYAEYLVNVAGADPGVVPYFQSRLGYWAIGVDGLPASVALETAASGNWDAGYPGFSGLGFEAAKGVAKPQYFRFPDGNASIARLLVRALVPGVAPGKTMEEVVAAHFDYGKLDLAGAPVRIRLNSTAVRVRHLGEPETARGVEVTYVENGNARKARADRCILACYNAMIPHLCPEIPQAQREALARAIKAPLVYSRVLLRDWQSFARLGLRGTSCPGSYHNLAALSDPLSIGEYRCPRSPEEPMVLELVRVPLSPGLSAAAQFKAGRHDLLSTSFEEFERRIRDQLARILDAGGFDPARDIEAITVNRWPHGYAYGYDPVHDRVAFLPDEWPKETRPWEKGRARFGRISIANSDAASNAMTEAAIDQGHRAAREALEPIQ